MDSFVFRPFDRFVMRTPTFSFGTSVSEMTNGDLFFEEALFLASSELFSEYKKGVSDRDKLQTALYKYCSRACTRCTPFGLFAGCSVGTIGEVTRIVPGRRGEARRRTRLDMNYLCALIQHLECRETIRNRLAYYPNDSVYTLGGRIRYVEYFYKGTRRVHRLTSVEDSCYLRVLLKTAESGATIRELAQSIVSDDISYGEAEEFVGELIDSQLLKSELEAAVTGEDSLDRLIGQLRRMGEDVFLTALEQISVLLAEIDAGRVGTSMNVYTRIMSVVDTIKVPYDSKYLFQTDFFRSMEQATVSERTITEIGKVIFFLNRITIPYPETSIGRFAQAFYERYEDREMPLLQVLDNELGLGYPAGSDHTGDVNFLIDDLVFPDRRMPYASGRTSLESILMKKYAECIRRGERVVVLDDADFPGMEPRWDDLNDTLTFMCSILEDGGGAPRFYVKSVGGASPASLIGRFCHLDPDINDLVREITFKEQELNPDAVLAEIAHLPESRIGNIASRPLLRDYEIHYLAAPGVVPEGRIPLSDLRLSCVQGRLALRSARLDKEVIPRLANAHNYSRNSMPVYHFLCDMQFQNRRGGLYFSWGDWTDSLDYLPRVQYRNHILAREKWTLTRKETDRFENYADAELLTEMNKLREMRGIPVSVVLPDGDNELYVDMSDPYAVRTLLSLVKKRPVFVLEEFIFDRTDMICRGADGFYTNEFIFPFYKNKEDDLPANAR